MNEMNGQVVVDKKIYNQAKSLEKLKGKEVAWDYIKAVMNLGFNDTFPDSDSEVWLYGFDMTAAILNEDMSEYNYLNFDFPEF